MPLTPQPIQPIRRQSLKSGLINAGAVGENDFPMDGVLESINFHFDTIGQMTLRPGLTALGTGLPATNLLGLYQFRDSGAGTNNQIMVVAGNALYYLAGSAWTSKRGGLTANSKARFTTFLDYVFMVNGTEATQTWDGNPGSSFGTTNAVNAPVGKFIDNYRSRVWISGDPNYPDRVYYSTLPTSVTTPAITWNTSVTTGQWIDISPSDGENITGTHRTRDALLVFKNKHVYRIYSTISTDPDPMFDVGTYSQESIVESKNGVYFHDTTGFYRYDGKMTEISRPVIDIVKSITLANYPKVAGWLEADGDHICWSIGTCTVRGVTYNNLVVRYTISTQVWTHYEHPRQMLVSSPYNDGTTLFTLIGDDNGQVLKANVGIDDYGTPISYSIVHPFDNIDGLSSTTKILTKGFFMNTGMAGANVNYQTPEDILNNFTKPVGQLISGDSGIEMSNVRGRKIKFRLSGSSVGQPISYLGYEILEGTTQLITFKP